jgi:stage II sporulation protein D
MRVFFVAVIFLFLLASCGNKQPGGPLPILAITEPEGDDLLFIPDLLPPEEVSRESSPSVIRVLINNSHFLGRVHEKISVTATGAFTVRGDNPYGEGGVYVYEAGEVFAVHGANDLMGYSRLYIEPTDPNDRITIIGLKRNWPDGADPQYRGRIEISATPGGFIVVNELLLEEYLYAVVPSEMPNAYGLEAAKVQAITARSFAYRQFYENRFRAYGAQIDDSVFSQVYNNLPETGLAMEAVRITQGLILTYEGYVITANYFSTSGGTTANVGEVWPSNGDFPSGTPSYLRARAQFGSGYAVGDLRIEENAAVFFRDMDVPGFERDFPFFRWQVRMQTEELTASINRALPERQRANPHLITAEGPGRTALAGTVASIGNLLDLEVKQRGQGGNIIELLLVGTNASIRVLTEFNIRSLLAPRNSRITLNDGNILNGWSMMPSAFFTMEKEHDDAGNLTAVTFFGGGHGHGVGMSQNGAKALLDMGFGYREVLTHFYPGAEITEMGG